METMALDQRERLLSARHLCLLHTLSGNHSAIALDTAKHLLDTGKCQVNDKREDDGLTPLHVAASWDNLQMCQLLVHYGADLRAASDELRTPLDLAKGKSREFLLKLVKRGDKKKQRKIFKFLSYLFQPRKVKQKPMDVIKRSPSLQCMPSTPRVPTVDENIDQFVDNPPDLKVLSKNKQVVSPPGSKRASGVSNRASVAVVRTSGATASGRPSGASGRTSTESWHTAFQDMPKDPINWSTLSVKSLDLSAMDPGVPNPTAPPLTPILPRRVSSLASETDIIGQKVQVPKRLSSLARVESGQLCRREKKFSNDDVFISSKLPENAASDVEKALCDIADEVLKDDVWILDSEVNHKKPLVDLKEKNGKKLKDKDGKMDKILEIELKNDQNGVMVDDDDVKTAEMVSEAKEFLSEDENDDPELKVINSDVKREPVSSTASEDTEGSSAEPRSSSSPVSGEEPVKRYKDPRLIELRQEAAKMPLRALRSKLLRHDVEVGPLDARNRRLYEKKWAKMELAVMDCVADCMERSRLGLKYSVPLEKLIKSGGTCTMGQTEEKLIREEFNSNPSNNEVAFFNYLLIDPTALGPDPGFREFLDAIFYVGKGKGARPHQHLVDASKLKKNGNLMPSKKIEQILNLWAADEGVISLHLFHNIHSDEAFIREGAIIEAIGLENLTNKKRGEFKGQSANWNTHRRAQFGALLLHKAYNIQIHDRCRPICEMDVVVPKFYNNHH